MTTSEQFDYIIIGSGIGGLYTALMAQEHGSVLLITKGSIEDANTRHAQGGIAAAVGWDDSPALHSQDTVAAGAGLCLQEAVDVLTRDGPMAISELVRLGVVFDTEEGSLLLAREGAHSVSRVLHAGGDATGLNIETALAAQLRVSRVKVCEHVMVTRIIVDDGGAARGVRVLDTRTGKEEEFGGKATVLATGGAGRLFRYTTNPEVATGDGVYLAFKAGAAIMDEEFYQFHPTALAIKGAPSFLISEAVRGEGAILRNGHGEAFMKRYSEQGDLAPRDVVARAIVAEMEKAAADHMLLDVTHLPAATIRTRFPTIYRFCLGYRIDMTKHMVPVAPAAHYMMGGVKTNLWGETTVAGLYACGEVASTGVHGANRLASNSLLETVVFGKRLLDRTLDKTDEEPQGVRKERVFKMPNRQVPCAAIPPLTLENVQNLMWRNAGIARNGEDLLWAARVLSVWSRIPAKSRQRTAHELLSLVWVGRLLVEGALVRQESRGAHYRTDFPEPSPQWELHTVFQGEERA
ncbi:MAG: L-aspartate oxidase [Dehalococcoidia bacterium]|nr:L-aspartate oxidase [Dehalococcoidia bacterium]